MINGNKEFPNSTYDHRVGMNRALGKHYQDIIDFFKKNNLEYIDNVEDFTKYSKESHFNDITILRGYQTEALEKWNEHNKKGCIVLPTGAGKTTIALKAIIEVNSSTLIVVPTINLMEQWFESIKKIIIDKNQVGMFGGGYKNIQKITITTYDSAYLKSPFLGNKFKFLIFDADGTEHDLDRQ